MTLKLMIQKDITVTGKDESAVQRNIRNGTEDTKIKLRTYRIGIKWETRYETRTGMDTNVLVQIGGLKFGFMWKLKI